MKQAVMATVLGFGVVGLMGCLERQEQTRAPSTQTP
jgi:hypothetical protein